MNLLAVTNQLAALAQQGRAIMASAGAGPGSTGWQWRITNDDGDQGGPARAEVHLYGAIDGWDLDGNDLAQEIRALDVDHIDLRINSPGGLVFDAIGVYTALVEHRAHIEAYVDGMAASAASFVAQAGAVRRIIRPGQMMIHDARGIVIGDPRAMRDMAEVLDAISDSIAEIYAARAGGTTAAWRERMTATTWYRAAAAVEAGLADEVTGPAPAEPDGPQDRAPQMTAREQMIRARHRVRTTTPSPAGKGRR